MRKITTVLKRRWVLKLRCRKCGKKTTVYGHGKDSWATDWENGWYVKGTEICPRCIAEECPD